MIHENCKKAWHTFAGIQERSGDLGMELELEGMNLPQTVTGWVTKWEGSLRGKGGRTIQQGENQPDTPYEYVCHRPVGLGLLEKKLHNLYKVLTTKPTEVVLTDRASTHIHVNMTSLTIRHILGYILVYHVIEPLLLRMCGPKRNGNLFCLPSYETGDMRKNMQMIVQAVVSGRRYWPSRRGKYAALNIDALPTLGSLELRCFPNEIDPGRLHTWATWALNIRNLAETTTEDTYMSILDRAYDEPEWIIRKIFGHTPVLHVCAPNNPYELITFGVEQAYELAREVLPVLDWKKEDKPTRSTDSLGFAILDDAAVATNFLPSGWNEPPQVVEYFADEELD